MVVEELKFANLRLRQRILSTKTFVYMVTSGPRRKHVSSIIVSWPAQHASFKTVTIEKFAWSLTYKTNRSLRFVPLFRVSYPRCFSVSAGRPPFGQMPFIVTPEGNLLAQSAAIMKYICKKGGRVSFYLYIIVLYTQFDDLDPAKRVVIAS